MVIFEDDQIIAFNKPAGLSSQGGRIAAHTLDDLLWAFARPGQARPRLIHRLDRDTSGVILTARTAPAAAVLGRAMMARRMKKTYLAIVAPGAPAPREGLIETPLRRESIGPQAYVRTCPADHPGAMAAATRYRTLDAGETAALVELSPRTGRMHQLRVHMASIGRPIAGDARYGGTPVLAGAPAPRTMLHAAALAFVHPSGGPLTLAAPLADDMAQALHSLGLAHPSARNSRQAEPL
jgi:tRNA pseudouridine32 synthase/23S rRNA pseudouridine746 synthase